MFLCTFIWYLFMLWCLYQVPHDTILCDALIQVASREIGMFYHDDVIKWKRFPRYWPSVWGIHRSPVNSPHKGQCRGALMFSMSCIWINGWINNREAGRLRRYRAHYDVIVMRSGDDTNIFFLGYVIALGWWWSCLMQELIKLLLCYYLYILYTLHLPQFFNMNDESKTQCWDKWMMPYEAMFFTTFKKLCPIEWKYSLCCVIYCW